MCIELRQREWRGKPIKETTVQKYLTTVFAVRRDAKKNEIIQKNPARMIDLPDTERVKQYIPTDYEAKEIINLLLDEAEHFKIFYLLAMYTGCRRGELCALKWSDITITNDVTMMMVSRSRSSLPGCGVMEGKTKNGFPKEFHLHTLRHYFVSTMLHSGVDKQTVADLAGHGDTTFLERTYCHPQTLLKQKAAVGTAKHHFWW